MLCIISSNQNISSKFHPDFIQKISSNPKTNIKQMYVSWQNINTGHNGKRFCHTASFLARVCVWLISFIFITTRIMTQLTGYMTWNPSGFHISMVERQNYILCGFQSHNQGKPYIIVDLQCWQNGIKMYWQMHLEG